MASSALDKWKERTRQAQKPAETKLSSWEKRVTQAQKENNAAKAKEKAQQTALTRANENAERQLPKNDPLTVSAVQNSAKYSGEKKNKPVPTVELTNPRATTAADRKTEKAPISDRAKKTAEIRKDIDTTPTQSRVGKGAQSVFLSPFASMEYLGEAAKQTAENRRKNAASAGVQDYAAAVSEFNRVRKLYPEGSAEYQTALRNLELAQQGDTRQYLDTAVDPNSRASRFMGGVNQLQEEALEGTSGAGRFLGEAALSIGGNLSKLPLNAILPGASLALMGAEAAAGKAYELGQQGVGAGEALTRGLVSGGIEALTEKVPLDNLMDIVKTGGKTGLWNIVKQAATEAGEEGASYILNYGADKVAGDPEAEFIWNDFWRSMGMGALSGGLFGGGATAINRMNAAAVGKNYQDVAPELIAEGLELGQDTEAFRTATEMQRKVDAGKTLSNVDVGRMVQDNEAAAAPLKQIALEMAEEEIRAREQAQQAAVARNMGYGNEGAKTFSKELGTNRTDAETLVEQYDKAYQSGLIGARSEGMSGVQLSAYAAGKADRDAQRARDLSAKPAAVYSRQESGFDFTNAPSDITERQRNFGNLMAKTFGIKGNFVEGETDYNARYVSQVGEVNFAKDFGIDQQLMQKLGDMDFQQKVEQLANKRQQSFAFYVAHEIADHVAANRAPAEMRAFNNAMYGYLRETEGANLARERMAFYSAHGKQLDTKGAIEEVAADSILMLYDGDEQKFMTAMERVLNGTDEQAKQGAKTWGEALKNIIEKLKAWARKLTGRDNAQQKANVEQGIAELERLRGMFESAIAKAAQNTEQARKAGETKNATQEGDVQHSLHQFADGRRFVDVNVEQEQFDGLSVAEMNNKAKKIIKSKFSGKVVGIDNKMFVNGKSAEKYVYYPHGTEDSIIEAKARASTELDNLIDAGTNFRTAEDGADGHVHLDAVGGFSYFDTIFKVGDQYYQGVVNIKNIGKGRLSHGVTKVENITQDIHDSYGKNPTIIFLRDASMETVPHTEDNVNSEVQYSLKSNGNKYASKTYAEITEEQYALNQRERSLEQRKREANSNPELLQAMDDYHSLFSEMRKLLSKKNGGTATQAELDRIEKIKALREERKNRVVELQESLGLGEIANEEEAIREEKEALRVAADAAWKREGAEKENKAIEKSGLAAPEYFRKKALKAFKTTANFNEAGYMLPDGKLLNFSGGERNHRHRDHREIGEIYEATQGTDALNRFLNDGNIRVMAESPGIDIAAGVEPTKEQYAALRRFINSHGTKERKFFVDFSGEDGRRVGNYVYEGRVVTDRVINDIKYFYETGETREESSINKFLYSLKGEQQMAKELKRIREEGRKAGKSEQEIRADVAQVVEPEYAELLKTYGAIKTGETPARDVSVPEKTRKNRKVSQTVRTILEAEATPEEMVPDVQALVAEGALSFESYTDEQAIADATAKLTDKGWSKTFSNWLRDMDKGIVSKENTVTGWALYNNAANSGDTETALTILEKMVGHQRNAAQALQATRVLKKLSPETQLYGVQRSIEDLQDELNERYGEDKAPKLKVDPELGKKFLEATTEQERDDALKEIYHDVGRQMPSTFKDKWNAWRYLAMLGNPRTHVRNVVGNAGFAPLVAAKNLTATAIESVVSRASGGKIGRTKALIGTGKSDRALLKAAWEDYANVADVVSNGGKYSELQSEKQQIREGQVIFKNKALEKARVFNSKMLEKEDVWFSQPHYAAALASYCKANGIKPEQIAKGGKLADKARAYAIKEAQKATYKDTNQLSQVFGEIGKRWRTDKQNGLKRAIGIGVEGVLPFRKTPANILARGLEYSPVGLLNGVKKAVVDVQKGDVTAAEAIDNIAAGLTGTGLLAFGVFLAAQGLVRGRGEDDEKEREFAELQGHQAYSMELPNGTSVTLDWLAPEALPFFIGVNLYEMTTGKKEEISAESLIGAVGSVTEPLLEMSCLQSLNDLLDSVSYAGNNDLSSTMAVLASAATSYLTQAIPTLGGQIERTSQDVRMSTYTDKNNRWVPKDLQYTLGKATSRIPGVDYGQIPYIDAWGRTESTGSRAGNAFNNFLNPAYTDQIGTSDMEEELNRLYRTDAAEGKSIFPTGAKRYVGSGDTRKDLTAEEYVQYATEKGQTAYDILTELVESELYAEASDEDRASVVDKAHTLASQAARAAVQEDFSPDSWVRAAMDADTVGLSEGDVILYRLALEMVDDNSSVSQDDAEAAIGMLEGLSKTQKAYLWQTTNTGWKEKNNPWK